MYSLETSAEKPHIPAFRHSSHPPEQSGCCNLAHKSFPRKCDDYSVALPTYSLRFRSVTWIEDPGSMVQTHGGTVPVRCRRVNCRPPGVYARWMCLQPQGSDLSAAI